MRAGWSEDEIATDASEWGLGAVIGRFNSGVVKRCGKLNERWRFRLGRALQGARAQAGVETRDGDLLGARQDAPEKTGKSKALAATWEEVPEEILKGPWRLAGRCKGQRSEDMNVLEGRAFLLGINRLCRRGANLNKRAIIL